MELLSGGLVADKSDDEARFFLHTAMKLLLPMTPLSAVVVAAESLDDCFE